MEKEEKTITVPYTSPDVKIVRVKLRKVICGSYDNNGIDNLDYDDNDL